MPHQSITTYEFNSCPVAIGGVGGSGTRLIAEIVKQLGYFIGSDLNPANDNLLFTLLFKHIDNLYMSPNDFEQRFVIFEKKMLSGSPPTFEQQSMIAKLSPYRLQNHPDWLNKRVRHLNENVEAANTKNYRGWGWKEPNTHIFVDRLLKKYPTIKYIHVMRHGLDMAFSNNQNQLNLWGEAILGYQAPVTAKNSFDYWLAVHTKMAALAEQYPDNILLLNYDELCLDPTQRLESITDFLQHTIDSTEIWSLAKLCKPPASMGRYKSQNIDFVTTDQKKQLMNLGYQI